MSVRIVEITATKIVEGDIVAEAQVLGDDTIEDTVFTIPGFQSRPVDGTKFAVIETASGDNFFLGIPNEGAIEKGEARMFWTDSSGTVKGEIYGQADGKLDILAKGIITVKSDIKAIVEAPKIVIKGPAGEAIDALQKAFLSLSLAFLSLSTATAGGFPLTNAAAMVTAMNDMISAMNVFVGMHE